MKKYRPLPDYLTIKESKIDRLGLFATHSINVNTLIGITHIHRWEDGVRTPLGGFINHSNEPNCKLVREEKSSESKLLTLNFIKSGEELTLKYEMYEVDTDPKEEEFDDEDTWKEQEEYLNYQERRPER